MSRFGFRRRRPAGRHAVPSLGAVGATVLPGVQVPVVVELASSTAEIPVRTPAPDVEPVAPAAPHVAEPLVIPVSTYVPPLEAMPPLVEVVPDPREVMGSALMASDGAIDVSGDNPRVGLFFGDGTHVFIDAADPRAVAFKEIADELNR